MESLSEKLKSCGIKIKTNISGVNGYGSGVLYSTPNRISYNYVLTAKHLFQEDSNTPYDSHKVGKIELEYLHDHKFHRLDLIKKSEVKDRLIVFEEDFAVIKVSKNHKLSFRQIFVADELQVEDEKFFFWAVFSANEGELSKFNLERNDITAKRFSLHANLKASALPGMSGAGVFLNTKSVLYGIISRYPNEDFQNETIDCTRIKFADINLQLKSLGLVELSTENSSFKREVGSNVVDINQAIINDACLNLELARRRLSTDISDDWFYDPLKYIDLLNQDYLFAQLEPYLSGVTYEASVAERFYVPKKQFTLRQSLNVPFIDRIMYMAAVGVIAEKLDSAMINSVYSARYNRFSKNNLILNGVEQWKKLQYQLEETVLQRNVDGKYDFNCVIEVDLLNFYDNISKKLLHEKVLRVCETQNEKNAALLLTKMLRRFSNQDVGLPQNSDASSLLASFYLNQVDVFMQSHGIVYYRFMDDIRIFCKNKFEARRILQTFEFELRRCYLSVNSQKTKIITLIEENEKGCSSDEKFRKDFFVEFNFDLAKISRYRQSENQQYLNEAFHGSIKLIKDNIKVKVERFDDAQKRLNFAFNTFRFLAIKKFSLENAASDFLPTILKATKALINRPWTTTEVCKVLNYISSDVIETHFIDSLKRIVLKVRYNTYAFQTYQIWLLLAKHKCNHADLKAHAIRQIERNDDTNRSVIGAMIIYLCSVNPAYRRVVLRKLGEGFTHGYFQNRIALIALRHFTSDLLPFDKIESTLNKAHAFSHRWKEKDLVFVQGAEESEETEESEAEQLYSL
ncbi:reverse transcriptase domain-containing protein [Pedobacter sp. SYSU D00535]|uniref:reverse transcriptase domain-containing protein n=1 Tax=Pedobacter sp. SYSU D00535 TaxID=2810308 RepID=UPI001A96D3F0|nr:reverse transcriptase domain-containing protein [Pedobacter sp. SYSU D00535]